MRRSIWLLMGKVQGGEPKPRAVYWDRREAEKRHEYLTRKAKAVYWIEKVPYYESTREN